MLTIDININELLDSFISNVEQHIMDSGKKWKMLEINTQTNKCRIVNITEIEKGEHIIDADLDCFIEWNGGFEPFEYALYDNKKSRDCLDINLIVTLENPTEKKFAISLWKKTARKYLRNAIWDYRDRSYIGITYL